MFLTPSPGKLLVLGYVIWSILTTVVPHFFPIEMNSIPHTLQGQKIHMLIAHPDDEVMFFGPTIVELLKPEYGNELFVTCFSSGNAEGLGQTRRMELERSMQILGVGDKFEVLDDETRFQDSMTLEWDDKDVLEYVRDEATVILTFDGQGISNHPNHISLYNAALKTDKIVYLLKSWGMAEKYSGTMLTKVELLWKIVKFFEPQAWSYPVTEKIEGFVAQLKKTTEDSFKIYSDLPSSLLIIASMMNAHKSQMVWFRYGWLLTSRYLNTNELVRVQ